MTSFLERYLKKTRSEEITYEDFRLFLQQGIEENQNVDYKSGGLLVDKNGAVIKPKNRWDIIGFSALAKTVAGFANAEGGLLVLGVEELDEYYDNAVIRIRPGPISPLPMSMTREEIENQLLAKIHFPIEGMTIIPVRPDGTHVIYLIDVPQSIRIPHRVNELFYYQRYNFSTLELQHFQIADLFGKRFAPDLDVELKWSGGNVSQFQIHPIIYNHGRTLAKYFPGTLAIESRTHSVDYSARWGNHNGDWEYHGGMDVVVYPDRPLDTDTIHFRATSVNAEAQPIIFHFGLYAEDMVGKKVTLTFDPNNHPL